MFSNIFETQLLNHSKWQMLLINDCEVTLTFFFGNFVDFSFPYILFEGTVHKLKMQ